MSAPVTHPEVNLRAKPFHLTEQDILWVEETLAAMSFEEKLGQLFCLVAYSTDADKLKQQAQQFHPGGLMCRPMAAAGVLATARTLQENSRIPMLLAANLERGGNVATEGITIGSQMLVAACHNDTMGAHLGQICGREGAALGLNWSFSPVLDIDYNFRNPITNTRTFGSDPDQVRRLGIEYVRSCQQEGVAACIKHFPGDGMDERDQHLVSSINSMSCEEWDKSYGAVYRGAIDAGALTVMAGHILQPAYSRKLNPALSDEQILPATLSHEQITGLLKTQLGFNGLVVTDASTMAGMMIPMPRAKAVPQTIAAGCDMFLFTRSLDEDLAAMRQGIEDGIITEARLQDALRRILGLKAALGLHRRQQQGTLVPALEEAMLRVGCRQHQAWAQECADQGITLVKEEPGVLPLSPQRTPRLLYYPLESGQGFAYSARTGVVEEFRERLVREGFDVTVFKPAEGSEGMMRSFSEIADHFDVIVYLANMVTKSNQTTVRIEWAQPMGTNVPVYMGSVPTLFISVENPYHLLDVPRVRTYINAYNSSATVLDALVDKLMGRSAFKGKSPVDAFCGLWDAHLQ